MPLLAGLQSGKHVSKQSEAAQWPASGVQHPEGLGPSASSQETHKGPQLQLLGVIIIGEEGDYLQG